MKRAAPAASEPDTRERILAAALTVFAERGFEAGTVRDITEAARVNTAAINYYFRSKEELIRQVFEAGLKPIIRARSGALEACIRQSAPALPKISAVAEALVRPLVELGAGEYRDVMTILMQVRTGQLPLTKRIVEEQFGPVHERFVDLLQKLLPDLSRTEIALRYDCARGAVLQTLVHLAPASALAVAETDRERADHEKTVRRLVRFVSAGLEAPPG
jgi:AcrR family transcriptional regulator